MNIRPMVLITLIAAVLIQAGIILDQHRLLRREEEAANQSLKIAYQWRDTANKALDLTPTNLAVNWNALMSKFQHNGFSNVWFSLEHSNRRFICFVDGTNAVVGKIELKQEPKL